MHFYRSTHTPQLVARASFNGKVSDLEEGDIFVIIGGQSRSSKVIEVPESVAQDAAAFLNDISRDRALEFLEDEGHDIGTTRISGGNNTTDRATREGGERTKAEKLQVKAEREGYGSLTHNQKRSVACRLLYQGKDATHEWISRNMEAYDPDVTEKFLTDLLEQYAGDYN